MHNLGVFEIINTNLTVGQLKSLEIYVNNFRELSHIMDFDFGLFGNS